MTQQPNPLQAILIPVFFMTPKLLQNQCDSIETCLEKSVRNGV